MISTTVSEKKINLKGEQIPQSQGHCDLRKGAKYSGSGPDYQNASESWRRRLELCTQAGGEYCALKECDCFR